MKNKAAYRRYYHSRQAIPYPNAASPREVFQKVLDIVLLCASGAGLGIMLLFLLSIA